MNTLSNFKTSRKSENSNSQLFPWALYARGNVLHSPISVDVLEPAQLDLSNGFTKSGSVAFPKMLA